MSDDFETVRAHIDMWDYGEDALAALARIEARVRELELQVRILTDTLELEWGNYHLI